MRAMLYMFVQAFYEADILDEEVLIEWHSKVSKKYVSKELSQEIHAKAELFIKWLKEAEEESSEEEESDVEVCQQNIPYLRSVIIQRCRTLRQKCSVYEWNYFPIMP